VAFVDSEGGAIGSVTMTSDMGVLKS